MLSSLEKRYEDLSKRLDEKIAETEFAFELDGCSVKDALISQVMLERNWMHFQAQVNRVFNEAEYYTEEALSKAIAKAMKSQRMYSSTEVKRIAENDSDYLDLKLFSCKAAELKEATAETVDMIHSRRYVLNNLTNAIIASVDKQII